MKLLEVLDLSVYFYTDDGVIRAVDGLSFALEQGSTLGIVGESGCGKSVTALSILRLVPSPGKIVSGKVMFGGEDLLSLPDPALRRIRGKQISMVFQDPMTSLNPVLTIGSQISEAIMLHEHVTPGEAKKRAIEMLNWVKIPSPAQRYEAYPHELSGGMRQRGMIAIALSCRPSLLIADEPTTALDVTVQAQILELLRELQSHFKMSIILITHNLGIVAQMCNEVLVMYAGRAVEKASLGNLFKNPRHPYTHGLLTSIPRLHGPANARLIPIEGQLPVLKEKPGSCTFAPRCKLAAEKCWKEEPGLFQVEENHESRCFFFDRVELMR